MASGVIYIVPQVTGLTGVVTAIISYLSGHTEICIQPAIDDKGAFQEHKWFAENQVVINPE